VLARITQFSSPVLEMAKRVISPTIGLPLAEAIRKSQDIYLNQLASLEDSKEGLQAVSRSASPCGATSSDGPCPLWAAFAY